MTAKAKKKAAAPTMGWAPVGRSGKVLRWGRRLSVYTHRDNAEADCPSYGTVERVRISVVRK